MDVMRGLRGLAVLCAAAVLLVGTSGAVRAQGAEIGNVRVGTSADVAPTVGDELVVIPPGTSEIYVAFDYSGASNQQVAVKLIAPGNIQLYASSAKSYSGSGTDNVRISGADIYDGLTGDLFDNADGLVTTVDLLTNQSTRALSGYLGQAQGLLSSMRGSVMRLQQLELGGDRTSQLDTIESALDELDGLVEEALAAEDDEVRAIAADMEAPAMDARQSAEALADSSAAGLPIPETAASRGAAYTVGLLVDNQVADSAEFVVTDDAVPSDDGDPAATPRPTTDRSGGGDDGNDPRPTRAPTRAPDRGGDDGGGDDAGTSGQRATRPPPTLPSVATRPASAGDASSAGTSDEDAMRGADEMDDDARVSEADAPAGAASDATTDQASGADAAPTWTALPGAQGADRSADDVDRDGETAGADGPGGSGSGPNLAVLALGAALLGVLALWLRQRV